MNANSQDFFMNEWRKIKTIFFHLKLIMMLAFVKSKGLGMVVVGLGAMMMGLNMKQVLKN